LTLNQSIKLTGDSETDSMHIKCFPFGDTSRHIYLSWHSISRTIKDRTILVLPNGKHP